MNGYKNGTVKLYKGYTILKTGGEWIASAYANPTFHGTNLTGIKKQINEYLRQ